MPVEIPREIAGRGLAVTFLETNGCFYIDNSILMLANAFMTRFPMLKQKAVKVEKFLRDG
jgi:hypothetical protein